MAKVKRLIFIIVFISLLQGCGSRLQAYQLEPGVDTILVGTVWVDRGLTVRLRNGTTETVMAEESTLDTEKTGIYEVTYRYGNLSIVRYVAVIDMSVPDASIRAGVDTIQRGTVWQDAGVRLNEPGLTVRTEGSVDSNQSGLYTVRYIVKNRDGQELTLIRKVTVLE